MSLLLCNCIFAHPQLIAEVRTKKVAELQFQTFKIGLPHFHNSQPDAESDPLESGIICFSVARAGPENNIRDSAPDQNNVKIIFYPCTS